MKFQDQIKQQLVTYRKNDLGIKEEGFFSYRGKKIPKGHVLPLEFREFNILEHYRDKFYSSPESNIHFHQYFHHLNSSQALCINLFFPLVFENKLNILSKVLSIPINEPVEACFEKESQLEKGNRRKTNFDFYIQLSDATKIYFEVKYTEEEFGMAKDDGEHTIKFKETYEPLLENNIFINKEYHNMSSFLSKYQIMRNLCHVADNSHVVFVYPEENINIHRQALFAQNEILTDKGRNKFHIIPISTIVNFIINSKPSRRMQKQYYEFIKKYQLHEIT